MSLTACNGPSGATPDVASTSERQFDRAAIGGASEIIGERQPEILSPGNDQLQVSLSGLDVVLSSKAGSHDYDEVSYVITLDSDPTYNLQFSSAAELEDFAVRVSYKRLYRGTYTVKAYGRHSADRIDLMDNPFTLMGEGTFRVHVEGL